MAVTSSFDVTELRKTPSKSLDALFKEEIQQWRDDLQWDYAPSVELIRKFIDSHALGGAVVTENGAPAGYGFYVLEDYKGLIGGLFVSQKHDQSRITQKLLSEMTNALRSVPRLQRMEAQLMPFGTALDPSHLTEYFQIYSRKFMILSLDRANLKNKPLSSGLRLEPWTDRAFPSAARLIQLAYADHVDSQINDQYRTEAGGIKFLRNIVLLPGCGQFLPEASFLIRPPISDQPIGMVLTSTVAPGVGHTTQICIMPGHQGHSVGRQLMECSIHALQRRNFKSLSLTVTAQNTRAVELYEHLGFKTVKEFAAGVWER